MSKTFKDRKHKQTDYKKPSIKHAKLSKFNKAKDRKNVRNDEEY